VRVLKGDKGRRGEEMGGEAFIYPKLRIYNGILEVYTGPSHGIGDAQNT
jgi:hypothetical protein